MTDEEPGRPLSPARRGVLLILTAPSGTGKGAVRTGLLQRQPHLHYGVSVTTRRPRPDELDGRDYIFVSRERFETMAAEGAFVEWAEVYGHRYGTPREPMESLLAGGQDVILEKDVQGAAILREVYPDGVYIFLVPPSLAELRRRLVGRGTEGKPALARRLASARAELAQWRQYDFLVINDRLEDAVARVEAIYLAETARVSRLERLPVGPEDAADAATSTRTRRQEPEVEEG